MTTLLQVLALKEASNPEEIAQAYRNQTFLALKTIDTDYERFYAVSDAFQALSNPSIRATYLQLGDKQFFELNDSVEYVDAVDLLLDSFGVSKVPFVTVPAFNIILKCFQPLDYIPRNKTGHVHPDYSPMRRPGWLDGKAKLEKMSSEKPDYGRANYIPHATSLQSYIDEYGEKAQEKLTRRFQFALGLDWMHVLGAVLYARGETQYTKCRNLISTHRRVKCALGNHITYAKKLVRTVVELWARKNKPYKDQVNMFYLLCMFALIEEVQKALDNTVDYLFDVQKHNISKRKDRMEPAQHLADMGCWMKKQTEFFVCYDDILATVMTFTAYHLVYDDKTELDRIPYMFPSGYPERSKTLVKIALDVTDLVEYTDYEMTDMAKQEMMRAALMGGGMACGGGAAM